MEVLSDNKYRYKLWPSAVRVALQCSALVHDRLGAKIAARSEAVAIASGAGQTVHESFFGQAPALMGCSVPIPHIYRVQ